MSQDNAHIAYWCLACVRAVNARGGDSTSVVGHLARVWCVLECSFARGLLSLPSTPSPSVLRGCGPWLMVTSPSIHPSLFPPFIPSWTRPPPSPLSLFPSPYTLTGCSPCSSSARVSTDSEDCPNGLEWVHTHETFLAAPPA